MNSRFLITFLLGLLIILVAVVVILVVLFRHTVPGPVAVTATPAASAGAITVRNDTAKPVEVQDCRGALATCATNPLATTRLAPGASGSERGATGLRLLDLRGHVLGCISLAGAPAGNTVLVSSATACPSS